MQTLIAIFTLITQLLPLVLQMVTAIESNFPQKGQGAAKLAMVKGTLEKAFETLTDVKVSFDQIWPTLSTLIASIVALKNATGEFKK